MNKWAASRASGFASRGYLIGQHGAGDCFHIELPDGPFTIGRATEANLQVGDEWVSRLHCEIWTEQGGYHLKDLGSRNGTWINEWPVREAPLCDGDRVRVGKLTLMFHHVARGRRLQIGETVGEAEESTITTPLPQIAVHATASQPGA